MEQEINSNSHSKKKSRLKFQTGFFYAAKSF